MHNDPHFHTFLGGILTTRLDHYATNQFTFAVPTVEFELGAKFIRIVHSEFYKDSPTASHRSAAAFVATQDFSNKMLGDVKKGDVFKSASYKAPAKHARGNIYDTDNGLGSYGPYGPAYLR